MMYLLFDFVNLVSNVGRNPHDNKNLADHS